MEGLTKAQRGLLMTAILFVALNLRPALAAIGPMTEQILLVTALGSTGIGLLTTLPVILMGVGAMAVRPLRRVLGEKLGIGVGILIVAVSCGGRAWLSTEPGLLATSVGAGIGISVVQALAPGFLKRNFAANTGGAIGLYSTGIVVGAALAAAGTARLSEGFGWAGALACWALPALLAACLWIPASRPAKEETRDHADVTLNKQALPFSHALRSWSLLIFFGLGTGVFLLVMAWLPPFYVELGQTERTAGDLLAVLTGVEALTALGLAALIHRFPDRRGPLVTCLLLVLAGLGCLLLNPVPLAIPAVIVLGIGIGILFPLSIIVAIDHIDDPTAAGNFTAFVQGGGYIVASIIPLAAGALRDRFSSLGPAWLLMAVGIAGLIILATRYSPISYLAFRRAISPMDAK